MHHCPGRLLFWRLAIASLLSQRSHSRRIDHSLALCLSLSPSLSLNSSSCAFRLEDQMHSYRTIDSLWRGRLSLPLRPLSFPLSYLPDLATLPRSILLPVWCVLVPSQIVYEPFSWYCLMSGIRFVPIACRKPWRSDWSVGYSTGHHEQSCHGPDIRNELTDRS